MTPPDEPPEKRFYDANGKPRYAEFATAQLMNMAGAPNRDVAWKHGISSVVYGLLDMATGLRQNAAASRELAASYDSLVDEMRIKRGAPEQAS